MARIQCRKKDENLFMEVSGEATIGNIARVRSFFSDIVHGRSTTCRIDLSPVISIDLPFVQLLISFRNSMEREGKTVTFDPIPWDHPVTVFIMNTGIDPENFFRQRSTYGI